ncbi:MAG: DAK2 domain-containing protein [Anaerolineae bacterium]|nr:DAK2 domain-containing protein [Thermoflexales bacterium]MDW8408550.1 DAK2 domain-containing protein [Anaerolineae bacterium]
MSGASSHPEWHPSEPASQSGSADSRASADYTGAAHPPESADAATPARRAYHLTLDGRRFKELIKAGYQWLRAQEAIVNSYNVYPVPDGDTGTNMMHTMRSAWESIAELEERNIGAIAKAVSYGALRGSRGNSGIILSQIWRGFARSVDHKDVCDAQDIALALREAVSTAYAGVNNPVEGTMLTVIREVAESAEQTVSRSHDLRELLRTMTRAAYESVQRTPTLLKILKEAGVVDSGGYGLYVILDGMSRFLSGQPLGEEHVAADKGIIAAGPQAEGGYGYDVQYLIYAPADRPLDVSQIRRDIEAMGDCPLVMGDERMVKVHVHVPDPGVPLSYGAKLGSLRDVVVEDMQAQSESFLPGVPRGSGQSQTLPPTEIAIIAVASGEGLIRAFKDVGARIVIHGGQTMNPSVDDFLKAIQQANARHVILLPNNGNIIMTAQQAAQLSEVPAKVVPTRTIPQGIAAAIAFNFERDVEGNLRLMSEAAGRVITCEITRATRTVTVDGVSAREGQLIGLIDDRLALAGDELEMLTSELLEQAGAAERELITLYHGNDLPRSQAEFITNQMRQRFPDQVIDLYEGQQAHYYFIIGIE